jgi:hypothetical protein
LRCMICMIALFAWHNLFLITILAYECQLLCNKYLLCMQRESSKSLHKVEKIIIDDGAEPNEANCKDQSAWGKINNRKHVKR